MSEFATKAELEKCRADVEEQMRTLEKRLEMIELNTQSILDIVQAWNSARGFIMVIRVISATIKVMAPIAAVFGAMYYVVTHGQLPPKP